MGRINVGWDGENGSSKRPRWNEVENEKIKRIDVWCGRGRRGEEMTDTWNGMKGIGGGRRKTWSGV